MKLPTWGSARDPLCWLLGAGTFAFLVATNNPTPIFVGGALAIMGIPGAFGVDNLRRERRRQRSASSTTTREPLSGSSSAPPTQSSLPSTSTGGEA